MYYTISHTQLAQTQFLHWRKSRRQCTGHSISPEQRACLPAAGRGRSGQSGLCQYASQSHAECSPAGCPSLQHSESGHQCGAPAAAAVQRLPQSANPASPSGLQQPGPASIVQLQCLMLRGGIAVTPEPGFCCSCYADIALAMQVCGPRLSYTIT